MYSLQLALCGMNGLLALPEADALGCVADDNDACVKLELCRHVESLLAWQNEALTNHPAKMSRTRAYVRGREKKSMTKVD